VAVGSGGPVGGPSVGAAGELASRWPCEGVEDTRSGADDSGPSMVLYCKRRRRIAFQSLRPRAAGRARRC
jgi:hypothetical protein